MLLCLYAAVNLFFQQKKTCLTPLLYELIKQFSRFLLYDQIRVQETVAQPFSQNYSHSAFS